MWPSLGMDVCSLYVIAGFVGEFMLSGAAGAANGMEISWKPNFVFKPSDVLGFEELGFPPTETLQTLSKP